MWINLDEMDTDLSAVDMVIKTGNKMADAIINSKNSLARSKDIPVKADAHIPVALTISELDLCIIIGNLFDNAIEASLALPKEKRLIRVYMNMKNTQLYMSFTNFTAVKKQEKNGRFLSSKGTGHGFGLIRIDNIVERYGGYLSRNSEDNAFTTEILLPQVWPGLKTMRDADTFGKIYKIFRSFSTYISRISSYSPSPFKTALTGYPSDSSLLFQLSGDAPAIS